jgi:glucose/arabinose dehydrogenase
MRILRGLVSLALATLMIPALPSPAGALPRGTRVQRYQGGLDFPIDMEWVRHTTKLFFTEKGGAIRVMNHGRLLRHPCATLDVNSADERGLLGIALDPKFKRNHKLYVYYTHASPDQNRVARFIVHRNRCRKKRVLVRGLGGSQGYHNGGQLEFMGGKLFVSVGEAHVAANAQNRNSRLGKILRYNPNGSIPRHNPFGNAVWSYGHRNPFGLAHEPGTRRLYETENGPECDDEMNIIRKGRNYGWGDGYQCGTRGVGPNPKAPLQRWSRIIVPTDPTWYRGRTKRLDGSVYVGDYGTGRLHRIILNRKGNRLKHDRIIFHAGEGIVDVATGPGGWLYFLTSSGIFRIVKK